MLIDTEYYERCIQTLDRAYSLLLQAVPDSIDYEMYRSACIKEFELVLEQSGKLLRKVMKPFFHSSKAVDELHFKDVFRHAVKHVLINEVECERWMKYRDNRNSTAHDYGVHFAVETLVLLPTFIADAKQLVIVLNKQNHASQR